MKEDFLEFIGAGAISICTWFFGGADAFLKVLIAFTIIDYVTGLLVAGTRHEICSAIGFKGIAKKCVIFALVGVAHVVEHNIFGDSTALRTIVCTFYISNEGISILENADKLGVPFPEALRKYFAKMEETHEQE